MQNGVLRRLLWAFSCGGVRSARGVGILWQCSCAVPALEGPLFLSDAWTRTVTVGVELIWQTTPIGPVMARPRRFSPRRAGGAWPA
jgi:hypothetical protein